MNITTLRVKSSARCIVPLFLLGVKNGGGGGGKGSLTCQHHFLNAIDVSLTSLIAG